MLGILTAFEIEDVLHHNILGRIGCYAKGINYIVPVSYAYDGEYVYGRTYEGMKVVILRENPHMCFEVEEMKDLGNWRSVICWGDWEELTDPPARIHGLEVLSDRVLPMISSQTTHLSPHWPFVPKDLATIEGIVFRVKPTVKSGRYEKNDALPPGKYP